MNICVVCVCVPVNCNAWVHLWKCLSERLCFRFDVYKCPNIDVLDGGGEHTLLSAWDGCVRPGSIAPHAARIATSDPISSAMESHVLMVDGSAGDRPANPHLLTSQRSAHMPLRHEWSRSVCVYVCSHAHVTEPQWKMNCSPLDVSVTEKIGHTASIWYFAVWVEDNIFSSDGRENSVGLDLLSVFFGLGKVSEYASNLRRDSLWNWDSFGIVFFPPFFLTPPPSTFPFKKSVWMGMLAQEFHLAVRWTQTPVTSWENLVWLCGSWCSSQICAWNRGPRLCQKGFLPRLITGIFFFLGPAHWGSLVV